MDDYLALGVRYGRFHPQQSRVVTVAKVRSWSLTILHRVKLSKISPSRDGKGEKKIPPAPEFSNPTSPKKKLGRIPVATKADQGRLPPQGKSRAIVVTRHPPPTRMPTISKPLRKYVINRRDVVIQLSQLRKAGPKRPCSSQLFAPPLPTCQLTPLATV